MTTDSIAADRLLPGLRAPGNRVSRRAISYWTARAALSGSVVVIVELLFAGMSGFPSPWRVVLIATAVLAALHAIIMPRWRFNVHRWEVTPQVVYTQSGWFNQERRIVPVSRIQTVDTERGPVERIFGLANLTVTTASARGPVHIHGLDLDTAQRLAAELATRTQATAGDAT